MQLTSCGAGSVELAAKQDAPYAYPIKRGFAGHWGGTVKSGHECGAFILLCLNPWAACALDYCSRI